MGTCLDRLKRQVPSLPRKTPISTPILPLVVDPVHHFVLLLWPGSLYFISFSLYAYLIPDSTILLPNLAATS